MIQEMLVGFNKIWERAPFRDSADAWQTSLPVDVGIIIYWIILFGGLLAICIWLLSNKKSSRTFESVSNHLLVVSSAIWFLGVVIYIIGYYQDGLNWVSVIPRAVISSFKMFVVTNELARVQVELQKDAIYMSVFSLVHFAAAFITFLFIFKMVGYKIKSSLKLVFHRWFHSKGKVVHLFWGVNEASCLLAEDIRKQHITDTIIFVDIDQESEDNTQRKATLSHIVNTITIKNSEIARLEAIDALVDHCYNGPAALKSCNNPDIFGSLHLKTIGTIVQKSSKAYFYFLSPDEVQNIAGALNLQKDRILSTMNGNPVIYIHARRDASNEIFDHYSQYDGELERMKIKIVDSAYLSIAALKQDQRTLPVNCVKINQTTGLVDSPFTALIVGFGGTGLEAFKFLYEYSAFVGPDMKKSPFKCYAIDEKMNKMAGLVREKMPAIGEDELSLIQAAVDSEEFWTSVKAIIKDLNYIVIALNNDSLGLSLAVNLFKYAIKNRSANQPMLKILVRCYDNGNEKRMIEVSQNLNKSIKDHNIEIILFGQEQSIYSCDTVLSDRTLKEAMEFNKVYENSELPAQLQWQKNFGQEQILQLMTKKKMSRYHAIYDINRRIAQNISNSLHSRTKMVLMGFGENDLSGRLKLYCDYVNTRKVGTTDYKCGHGDAQLLLNIAMVEHERWIASHKLMGYTYNSENDSVQKHHKCICAWDKLDQITQSYDCNVVDTTIKMAYEKMNKNY